MAAQPELCVYVFPCAGAPLVDGPEGRVPLGSVHCTVYEFAEDVSGHAVRCVNVRIWYNRNDYKPVTYI